MEILSPAGSFEAFEAAVQNGADAIYIGGRKFSARAFASNFGEQEIEQAVRYAHIRDVKVYVTVNTLVKESEKDSFMEYVEFLYGADVDALILQDCGMAKIINDRYPDFEIHASTQMSAHSLEDVRFLENMGFSRVVLSRELSIEEIAHISKNSKADIEIFVHGALCMSYSGQCLMSSMIGGRSGNRGRCAQPCRKEYELLDMESGRSIDSKGKYLLSPKDLCTIEEIGRIVDSGALSLKIEGRMKKPEYVATVTRIYKDAASSYVETGDSKVSQNDVDDLNEIFTRGFTKGYMFGELNAGIVSTRSQGNKGVRIGEVEYIDKKRKRLGIRLEKSISKGDGLAPGGIVGRVLVSGKPSNHADAGQTVELDYIGEACKGDEVVRSSNAELLKMVQKTYQNGFENKKIKIDLEFKASIGEYPEVIIRDDRGNEVIAYGDAKAEKALKVALDNEKVIQQLQKLGSTPYDAKSIDIKLQEGLSIPVKSINKMRRDAVEKLDDMRALINAGRDFLKEDESKDAEAAYERSSSKEHPQVRLKVGRIDQLEEILSIEGIQDTVECIYFECSKDVEKAASLCRQNGVKMACSLSNIMRSREYERLERLLEIEDLGFIAGSFGQVGFLAGAKRQFFCDYSLNVFNSDSANLLFDKGAGSVCVSPELTAFEIKRVCENSKGDMEALAYGRVPLMTSEYCLPGTIAGNCANERHGGNCVNNGTYAIKDRMGEIFPVGKSGECRSVVYNSKILCMLDRLSDLYNSGVRIFKIDLSLESPQDAKRIAIAHIDTVESGFEMDDEAEKTYNWLRDKGITNGHYYRGVE